MSNRRDPIQRVADGMDLYGIVSWDDRTLADHVAVRLHGLLTAGTRWAVIALAILILVAQFFIVGVATLQNPILGTYVLFSIVPAALLVGYVWRMDVTMHEPLRMLVVTFLFGFLFAGFAALVEALLQGLVVVPVVGLALFFYLVVAPAEETVKWFAVRIFAYQSDRFDSVVDGAVYGAAAGLGFATIENTTYIIRQFLAASSVQMGVVNALQTTAVRTFAGPGHVIYTALAGYYLGLAKFNPENRGPIVVKGLLLAALIHGTYDTAVSYLNPVLDLVLGQAFVAQWSAVIFVVFAVVYDGFFFWVLYRKLARYRETYVRLGASEADDAPASP